MLALAALAAAPTVGKAQPGRLTMGYGCIVTGVVNSVRSTRVDPAGDEVGWFDARGRAVLLVEVDLVRRYGSSGLLTRRCPLRQVRRQLILEKSEERLARSLVGGCFTGLEGLGARVLGPHFPAISVPPAGHLSQVAPARPEACQQP